MRTRESSSRKLSHTVDICVCNAESGSMVVVRLEEREEMDEFIIESWLATVLAPNICASFEGGNVCLRLLGSIGEGVNTLSRERGSCVSASALRSIFPLLVLVLGEVEVDGECISIAEETPSLLLLGKVILAADFGVVSALRRFCWMPSYFFWRRFSIARHKSHSASFFLPAQFVWHGFLQSEQKFMFALVRRMIVLLQTIHFMLPLR